MARPPSGSKSRPADSTPGPWERVLVRHVLAERRGGVRRLAGLIRAPFPGRCDARGYEKYDLRYFPRQGGRRVIAPLFSGDSWATLFTGDAPAGALVEANRASRRLEVAWVGVEPAQVGWFVRVHRAGAPMVDWAGDDEAEFRRLCDHWQIPVPPRSIRATPAGFEVLGPRGRPVRATLRGYVILDAPALAEGESPAADDLAASIEDGDPDGIRSSIEAGASLRHLPGGTTSPWTAMLHRAGEVDPDRWAACLDVLMAAGCSIDGDPGGDPSVLGVVRFSDFCLRYPFEAVVEFLVAHGADVNRANAAGETALATVVRDGNLSLVRLLLRHGADPHLRAAGHPSAIEVARTWMIEPFDRDDGGEAAESAAILGLLLDPPA